jgi:hypothetical protein
LANCNEHVAEANITAPAHTQLICTVPKAREVRVIKSLHFPVQNTRERATGISCFPCQTTTRSFLRFFAPPPLSLPSAPRLQAASSRKIVHMLGIGGDGEYCGGNDALGAI